MNNENYMRALAQELRKNEVLEEHFAYTGDESILMETLVMAGPNYLSGNFEEDLKMVEEDLLRIVREDEEDKEDNLTTKPCPLTRKDVDAFMARLEQRGYKRGQDYTFTDQPDWTYYKAFGDGYGDYTYQIFFEFWNFDQYRPGAGYGVSTTILPESCRNDVGRRDLKLSVDWNLDINRVEKVAEKFYEFLKKYVD